MKRITPIFLMLIICISNICFASNPFENNPNYIKMYEGSVPILYLDKNSVSVERYEPPIYEISCDTPLYDKYSHKAMRDGSRNLIRYNFDTKQVWIYNRTQNRWYEQDVDGASKDYKKLFNEVFEIAYNMKFYGGISDDRIAIGGICPLAVTADYIKSIYGEPTEIIKAKVHGTNDLWKYNDTLQIYVGEKNSILLIRSSGNNGLKTPDGIGVGDKIFTVLAKYGPAWVSPPNKGDGSYWYQGSHNCLLVFNVKKGIVTSISAGWNL